MFNNRRGRISAVLAIGSLLSFVAASEKFSLGRQAHAAPGNELAGAVATQATGLVPAQAGEQKEVIVFTVRLPANATLQIDDDTTKETGEVRTFQTPALPKGRHYAYTLKATFQGKAVTRRIRITHGAANTFDLRGEFRQAGGRAEDNAPLTEKEAGEIAKEAYVFGYPLVTMEMTRRVMTNTATPKDHHAPMGQFYNSRTYPDASFRDVTAPNADTLYSTAWLDVSKEPYVLSLPDEDGRYYLMPMLDAWTTVFQVPGKRTTGTGAQTYAITGPNWKGELPPGVTEYKSPTALVWILGRTYCTGTPEDYKAVHALQDKYSLVPLSAYGKPYTPPEGKVDPTIDMRTPVRDQVDTMDAGAYFALLAALMKDNPPTKEDAPVVAKMAKIGLVPGQDFEIGKLDPAVAKVLAGVPKAGIETIVAEFKTGPTKVNGWEILTKTGIYGTDYANRALVTAVGLGANRPQDAIYPTSVTDADGKPYNGANNYVMHFDKGQTPPVNGFWSLTMYDARFFFVPNKLNKYTVSPRDPLKYNDDGSLDIYIQNESPGPEREANWLPAPTDKFILMLRLYWPKEQDPSILDGTWKPPAVKPATK